MPKFKLLQGKHEESYYEEIKGPNGESLLDDDGKPVMGTVPHRFRPGQIIETPTNLLRFNRANCKKFEKVEDDRPADMPPPSNVPQKIELNKGKDQQPTQEEDGEEHYDAFSDMTVSQMRDFARENDIDLSGTKKRSDILSVLRQAAGAE